MKRMKIYNADGSTNITHLVNKKGTYKIFYKNQKKAVYIGFSNSNLYKTILRHFQTWSNGTRDGQQTLSFVDKGQNKQSFYLTYMISTGKKAAAREKRQIQKEKPKYNVQFNEPDF